MAYSIDRTNPARPVLRLTGDLDFSTAHTVREGYKWARTPGAVAITFDLDAVSFMDSAALYALEQAVDDATLRCLSVSITGLTRHYRRLLDIVGITDKFELTV